MVKDVRTSKPKSDYEIAASIQPEPIVKVAEKIGVTGDALTTYGNFKAKINPRILDYKNTEDQAKLVLVTGVSPTPAGEGKTTTTVGLSDSLNRIGVNSIACLREPSLGPCFGMKGGAHGGGYSQVTPMDDINLHFNGDIHAVTSAHNLLSSLIDNHVYWGNSLEIDIERIAWPRVLDLNDRVLRSLDLRIRRSISRHAGFNITAASEIMAILCLADDINDLQRRLGNIVVGFSKDGLPIRCHDIEVEGSLAVLLRDSLDPNLVQSLEHNPVLIHGGPFANIAHGCNSMIATRAALGLADVVVTEAGFGADLGAEKFVDIKCRQGELTPSVAVIVCTARSLKMHGGVQLSEISVPNISAVERGIVNLFQHTENLQRFGMTPIIAVNEFEHDTQEELDFILDSAESAGVDCCLCSHWANGGAGAEELAHRVMSHVTDSEPKIDFSYDLDLSLAEKITAVATRVYRAAEVEFSEEAESKLAHFEEIGYGNLPVCIAKTQYSFSADPTKLGAPSGFTLPVRDISLSAGAGFVVVLCGDIMTMPGLPRRPSAMDIRLDENQKITGLF